MYLKKLERGTEQTQRSQKNNNNKNDMEMESQKLVLKNIRFETSCKTNEDAKYRL